MACYLFLHTIVPHCYSLTYYEDYDWVSQRAVAFHHFGFQAQKQVEPVVLGTLSSIKQLTIHTWENVIENCNKNGREQDRDVESEESVAIVETESIMRLGTRYVTTSHT